MKREICNYPPIYFWIEPTNVCNLKCIMCKGSITSNRLEGYMNFNLYIKILKQIDTVKPIINLYNFGEPLLHPDIFDMIRHITQGKIGYACIYTNATLLNEINSKRLLIVEPHWLGFSFDGYDRETYEKIRKGSNYEETITNINNFLRIKRLFKKKKPCTYFNLLDFPEFTTGITSSIKKKFKKDLLSLGLNHFEVSHPHNWTGICRLSKDDKSYSNNYTLCPLPWGSLTILWDGTVVPCCFDINATYYLGNVNEDTIEEIWNGQKMRYLRNALSKGRYKDICLCESCHILHDKIICGIPKNILIELWEHIRTY